MDRRAGQIHTAGEAKNMSGRSRLPGGGLRKASQKRARPAASKAIRFELPFNPDDRVRWRDRGGLFRRNVDDEYAEIDISGRVYRAPRAELRQG
jgi:hypothetical protein